MDPRSHENEATPTAPLLLSPQRKELGVTVFNCSCLALDLHRVFLFYWQLHDKDYVPSIWSKRVTALYGRHEGLELQLNSSQAVAYVSVSNNSSLLPEASSVFVVSLSVVFSGFACPGSSSIQRRFLFSHRRLLSSSVLNTAPKT